VPSTAEQRPPLLLPRPSDNEAARLKLTQARIRWWIRLETPNGGEKVLINQGKGLVRRQISTAAARCSALIPLPGRWMRRHWFEDVEILVRGYEGTPAGNQVHGLRLKPAGNQPASTAAPGDELMTAEEPFDGRYGLSVRTSAKCRTPRCFRTRGMVAWGFAVVQQPGAIARLMTSVLS